MKYFLKGMASLFDFYPKKFKPLSEEELRRKVREQFKKDAEQLQKDFKLASKAFFKENKK